MREGFFLESILKSMPFSKYFMLFSHTLQSIFTSKLESGRNFFMALCIHPVKLYIKFTKYHQIYQISSDLDLFL